MKITYQCEILKPIDEVFPWIAVPEKAKKWQRNVKSEEIIIDNPEILGTTFKEIIVEDGNQLELFGKIIKYEKNKVIGFQLESKIHKLEVSYLMEQFENSTNIKIETRILWKFPMNIMTIFIGKKIEQGIIEQLRNEISDLKTLCEKNKRESIA